MRDTGSTRYQVVAINIVVVIVTIGAGIGMLTVIIVIMMITAGIIIIKKYEISGCARYQKV